MAMLIQEAVQEIFQKSCLLLGKSEKKYTISFYFPENGLLYGDFDGA